MKVLVINCGSSSIKNQLLGVSDVTNEEAAIAGDTYQLATKAAEP